MTDADRIAEILGAWLRSREAGRPQDPEAVIRAHPDLAGELRARFAAVALADQVFGHAGSPTEVPRRIGEYRILKEIGRGGMGVVYEAEQVSMQRRVALKVLSASAFLHPKAVRRFRQEAWAAGRLKHTNIVAVHQLGEERGLWYCAMELVEGRALGAVIEDLRAASRRPRETGLARRALGRDTPAHATSSLAAGTTTGSRAYYLRVAEMFAGVADALQVAHEHGVVHRDVKPGNLLLDADGNLKLLDFGLARLQDAGPAVTATGELLGTPLYMSPEQLAPGHAPLDHRSDVYSLGATLFETLTLRPPFPGHDVPAIATAILREDPTPLRRIDAHVPRDLETIVLKTLEKDPARRYDTAADLARDLRRFAEGAAIRARRIGPLGRMVRLARRHRVRTALAAALVLALSTALWLWADRREGRTRLATEERHRREMQYAMLCAQAEQAAVHELTLGADHALKQSRALFAQAIALLPDRYEAYLSRSRLHTIIRAGGGTVDADDLVAAAERGAPPRVVHVARAFLLGAQNRIAESEEELRRAEALPAGDPFGFVLEGTMAALRGDRERALALYAEALRRAPVGSTAAYLARWNRCLVHERAGDDGKALADLHAVEAMGDESTALRIRIAGLWRRLGRAKEAETLFEEIHSAARTPSELADLTQACDLADQPDWQEKVARDGLALAPDDVFLRMKLAGACIELGRREEALEHVDRVLKIEPGNHGAQCTKASVLVKLRRHPEALEAAAAAEASDPQCAESLASHALALITLRRLDEALALCRRGQEIDPDHPGILLNLARVLVKLGRPVEGLETADRALRILPREAPLHEARAQALAALGKLDDALGAIDLACEIAPSDFGHEMERGEILQALGRGADARASFERALASPRLMHRDRAYLLLLLGRTAEAVEAYRAAVEQTPEDPYAYSNLGNALSQLGRQQEAVPYARKTVELAPGWFLARYNLATALFESQQWTEVPAACDEGLAFLERGGINWSEVPYPPEEVLSDLCRYKGCALATQGDHVGAEASFRRAIEKGARDPELFRVAAQAANAQGKRDEALALLERAERERIESADLCYMHGTLLALGGRPADALPRLERACALAPDFVSAQVNRACVLADLDREREAIAVYEEALRNRGQDPVLLGCLGWLLATARREELRDPLRAIELARRVLERDEGNVIAWSTLGVALCRAERWEEALAALRRSIELGDGGEASDWFFLAIAQHRLGRHEEARATLARGIAWMDSHKPGDEELLRFRAEAAAALGQG